MGQDCKDRSITERHPAVRQRRVDPSYPIVGVRVPVSRKCGRIAFERGKQRYLTSLGCGLGIGKTRSEIAGLDSDFEIREEVVERKTATHWQTLLDFMNHNSFCETSGVRK